MSFRHLKIATRLGLGFGLIALLLILVIALGLNSMQQIQNRMNEAIKVNNVETRLAQTMDLSVTERALAVRNLILLKNEKEIQLEVERISEQEKRYPLHIVDMMPLIDLYGDLQDDLNYFQLVVDMVGRQTVSMVKWPGVVFDPVEIFEAVRYQPRSIHRVGWELLLQAGERQHAQVVMDKSLDSVHYTDDLMKLYPDMLFINVVRDPRAQVASMNRAIIHDFDTLLNTQAWVAAHQVEDHVMCRHPHRVLTIRYEDFLLQQQATLETICRFLGIDFLPQMLDVTNSQEARQIAQLSSLWSSNCFPPIAGNIEKFKQQLSEHEINLIETMAGKHMDRYGYTRLTSGNARISQDRFAVATECSGQPITDTTLSFSSATAGASPWLN